VFPEQKRTMSWPDNQIGGRYRLVLPTLGWIYYLLFNLVNLHPFLDGNKRTAFEVTKNFLRLNGWSFAPEDDDAFGILVSISKGDLDAESTERWIARNLRRKGERR